MRRSDTGILKIKRKKFGDEVLVMYMYDGEVIYAYSPFSGEPIGVRNVKDFLSKIVKNYKWDLTQEFTEMDEEELAAILNVPGIRHDKVSKELAHWMNDTIDGLKGVLSYGIFDAEGFLISGYNLDPSISKDFAKTYAEIKDNLKQLNLDNIAYVLTKHRDRVFSLFLPIKDQFHFFFLFKEDELSVGYVVSSFVYEVIDYLERNLSA